MLDMTGKTFHRLDMQPGCVPSRTGTRAPASLREAGAGIVRKLFHVVRNLRMRSRERRMPLELDDHMLRDIGLTRVEYRFLLMSRATTAPDRSQKQQESSRWAAVFALRFKRNRIPQT